MICAKLHFSGAAEVNKQIEPSFLMALSVYFGVIRPAEKVIERYAEVIGKFQQSFVICLALACFVTAYAVLVHIEVKGKLKLRNFAFSAQFL